jgi:CRP-like cAMP-binding protein
LNQLPASLRADVVKQTFIKIINKFRFLTNKDPDFLWAFLPALKPMRFYSKDILYSQGDLPEEVFFIQKGKVKLVFDANFGKGEPLIIAFNMYVEGSYFGEMEMMVRKYKVLGRDGSAIVDSECQLFVLNKHDLINILNLFPDVYEQMKQTANRRSEHHLRAMEEALKNNTADKNSSKLL